MAIGYARPMQKAFFAYPAEPAHHAESIRHACGLANRAGVEIAPWQQVSTIGLSINSVVESTIGSAPFLAADLTYYNFNVLYEIGYAIAKGKPVLPTVNDAVERATERIEELGIFDTIGYLRYQNSDELADSIIDWRTKEWTGDYVRPRDHTKPLFILDTDMKTDFRNHILNTVKNHGVQFRAFDPTETPRWPAGQAIAAISASSGVILPLLGSDIKHHVIHNLRAAFTAGLAVGYGLEPLLIQLNNAPAPVDYRRFVKTQHLVPRQSDMSTNTVKQLCSIIKGREQQIDPGEEDFLVKSISDRLLLRMRAKVLLPTS